MITLRLDDCQKMIQKSFYRTDRVAAHLRKELGALVHAAVREYRLPMMSVSDVEVTRDLAYAKVFVTVLQQEQAKIAVHSLQEITVDLRYKLARAVRMRHVPELRFYYDKSLDDGERINQLLQNSHNPEHEDEDEGVKEVGSTPNLGFSNKYLFDLVINNCVYAE